MYTRYYYYYHYYHYRYTYIYIHILCVYVYTYIYIYVLMCVPILGMMVLILTVASPLIISYDHGVHAGAAILRPKQSNACL